MTEPDSLDKLQELIERLQTDGRLSDSDSSKLEAILSADESARELYALSQELHTMLETDNSIRLQLASDLLPHNVLTMPGVDPSPIAASHTASKSDSSNGSLRLRMASSFAAMLVAMIVVIWMYSKVADFGGLASRDPAQSGALADQDNPDRVSFHKEILPILSRNCFSCHGENEEKREADLRLDQAKIATAGKTPAIVRGKPEKSEVVARITSDDPDYMMPPPESEKTLTKAQVDTIITWIAQGADYESGWSQKDQRELTRWLAILSDTSSH